MPTMVVRTKGLTANAQCMCDCHTYTGHSCIITIFILDMTVNKNDQAISLTVNAGELIAGKHYVKGVQNMDTLVNAQPHQVFWTKAGVIRLGFFIKSERAKLFRDWAEGLILAVVGQKQPLLLPAIIKRKHNRLTAADR